MAGTRTDTLKQTLSTSDEKEQHPNTQVMYCINHPDTETLIRCSKCLQPICTRCAVPSPVWLRCPECARGGVNPLHQLEPTDYAVVTVTALVASLLAGALVTQLGFFFVIFLAAPVGGLIAEAIMRATHAISGDRAKTGPVVQTIAGTAIALGALFGPWLWRVLLAGSLSVLPTNPLAYLAAALSISTAIYVVLAIGAAVARLR